MAITAIATDTGTAGDFITSDTTLIVSGTNGALAAGEKIQVSSDGANWFDATPIDSTHWSYDDTATSHTSSFTYQVRVIDAANNVGTTASQLVTIDTALPAAGTLGFTSLTDTGTANTPPVTQDNAFNLTLTGQETGASVAYQGSLNGGAFATTTASQSGLTDGDYQFRALVTDAAGNTSTSNVIEVVVDNAAPAEAVAITAIATDTGTVGDFITSDTTLIVSGTQWGAGGRREDPGEQRRRQLVRCHADRQHALELRRHGYLAHFELHLSGAYRRHRWQYRHHRQPGHHHRQPASRGSGDHGDCH